MPDGNDKFICQHEDKIDKLVDDVAFIRGKIEGIAEQKKSDVSTFGLIGAYILGVLGLIFK